MRALKSYVYHFGLGAGLPFPWLRGVADTLDFARDPAGVLRRRRLAREMPRDDSEVGAHLRGRGYALFDRSHFPEIDQLVATCRRLHALRAVALPPLEGDATFWHLLQPADYRDCPELLQFALSDRLIGLVVSHLGTLPRLQYLGLWLSPAMAELRGSHRFHLDKPDAEIVSVFVNIDEVAPGDGPLTFLPADESATVCRRTAYHRRRSGRLEDADVFGVVPPDSLVRLIGPAGSGGIVNTSRCLHLGSRCSERPRLVLAIKYALAQKALPAYAELFDGHRFGRDPMRSLLLEGSKPAY
jgi:hypothetical protein